MLESEKKLPRSKQSPNFLSGDLSKLVIDSYTRSMGFGTKYYYQTVPRVLTLWLDLGTEVQNGIDREYASQKAKSLDSIHKQLRKYVEQRLPAYIFYTAFPQIITRITHSNPKVWEVLSALIISTLR